MASASGNGDDHDPVSDTPGHLKAISLRLEKVERENAALACRLDDVGRQLSKDCIEFSGPALKLMPGEICLMMISRVVNVYWGFRLDHTMVKACHFLGSPKARHPRFIVKFLDLKEESQFAWILANSPCWNGREKVWAELYLHTANDRRLKFVARQMRASGQVRSFRFKFSGRLEVTFSDAKSKVFDQAKDLEKLADAASSARIKACDVKTAGKSRKRRCQ